MRPLLYSDVNIPTCCRKKAVKTSKMDVFLYQNIRNLNKYIVVKKSKYYNYYFRQLLIFDNGVVNSVGSSRGSFFRISKKTIDMILDDYSFVCEIK